jgi:hypothetical protein
MSACLYIEPLLEFQSQRSRQSPQTPPRELGQRPLDFLLHLLELRLLFVYFLDPLSQIQAQYQLGKIKIQMLLYL